MNADDLILAVEALPVPQYDLGEDYGMFIDPDVVSRAAVLALIESRSRSTSREAGLDAEPVVRLFGLTPDQIKRAIDIADLWHPQWRAAYARLSDESR